MKKTDRQTTPAAGSFLVSRPLEVVQIDHTKCDITVVDKLYRLPIGRPWLSVAMDIATRAIVGILVTFEPPSAATVALLITRIANSKLGCRCSQELIVSMIPEKWQLSQACELGVCAQCLLDDQAKGIPVYWRLSWLNVATVYCERHRSCLLPVANDMFSCFKNWNGLTQILLETAAQFVSGRTESHRSDRLDQCARFLPALFGNNNDNAERIAKIRYGCPDKLSARQVGIDLLDALLYVKKSERRYSALHAYAWYLKTRSNMQKLSVIVTSNRQMALRRVHAIEDRALAMTFIDAILFARARLNDTGFVTSTSRSRNFWMNSIWIFMPNSGIELLLQRAKSWSSDYVKTCWPELFMIEDVSMLQCNKNAVREAVIRENLRINQSPLANIRSN